MDELIVKAAFDYQRFNPNPKLEALIDGVYAKYLADGEIIPDEALDVSAAGETKPFPSRNGLHSGFAEGIVRDDK